MKGTESQDVDRERAREKKKKKANQSTLADGYGRRIFIPRRKEKFHQEKLVHRKWIDSW